MSQVADLFAAIQNGEAARVAAMLDGDPALVGARRHGASALLFARYHGRHEIVALIRRHRPALDVFEACALGDTERLASLLDGDPALANARLLLERGAPVDARQGQEGGFTPLMEAALNGQLELIDLLLRHGAEPGLRDADGLSAGDHARTRGHEEAVRRLTRG